MAKKQLDIRLDIEDIDELKRQAEKLDIAPSALARIFVRNGLTAYSPEKLRLMDSVDAISAATGSIAEMLLANLFLASRVQVMNLPKLEGESQEAYMARLGSESMRLIKVAMGNTKAIQKSLEGK